MLLSESQPLLSTGGGEHFKSLTLEVRTSHLNERGLIINDKDLSVQPTLPIDRSFVLDLPVDVCGGHRNREYDDQP